MMWVGQPAAFASWSRTDSVEPSSAAELVGNQTQSAFLPSNRSYYRQRNGQKSRLLLPGVRSALCFSTASLTPDAAAPPGTRWGRGFAWRINYYPSTEYPWIRQTSDLAYYM
eukprot:6175822-Pleurochrysis_carterae.AAC.2